VATTAVIVTNCTRRKAGGGQAKQVELPQEQEVERLAEAWQQLVKRAPSVGSAQSLYQGRTIADTAAAAAYLRSSWYVVSAGLGLIRSDQPVPAYECTVAAGSELEDRLKRSGATTADWWNAITSPQPQPLSRLIAQSPTLLALPSSYLRMVHDDLAALPAAFATQLRIFTSTAGAHYVPKHLAESVMPYDERLESVRNYAGTRSDFAQRALRHFVEALAATSLPLQEARAIVSAALAHQPKRHRSMGTRMSDDEIRNVLISQWTQHGGRSSRLLRYLRDEACISCEQKRFSRIWQALAAEFQA
jgi:hypothetical protein